MIGVAVRPHEVKVVEEFFELFKTPWEIHQPGKAYDVVVSTVGVVAAETPLMILYGSQPDVWDSGNPVTLRSALWPVTASYRGKTLPIYGKLSVFNGQILAESALASECGDPIVHADAGPRRVVRVGYDLFAEVEQLLVAGQPVEYAHVATLDLHIQLLRELILERGIALVEIPPVQAGRRFAVCLTHDIDFVGIRRHLGDHSMWGFLYRAMFCGGVDLFRRRISLARFFRIWRAVALLPLVFVGWAKDFWEPFEWYLRVEAELPATYFLIPFKHRQGERVDGPHVGRRATAYDVEDIPDAITALADAGCEIGVHGIGVWHSVEKGQDERSRVADTAPTFRKGIRMHWLLQDTDTASVLEQAGFAYDSTCGYNDTVGFRSGTTQVFRPQGCRELLELPLHVQDGALFFADRLNLTEEEAWQHCNVLQAHAERFGGVLTLLWHDRSHGPERFWGEFYERLVTRLKESAVWFGTASQVVEWFRQRRNVRFDGTGLKARADWDTLIEPPLTVRFHTPACPDVSGGCPKKSTFVDIAWNGRTAIALTSPEEALRTGGEMIQKGEPS